MTSRRIAVLIALAVVLTATAAQAHGLIGKRFFPATLGVDDPFVADELSLPTISSRRATGWSWSSISTARTSS